jgi:PAT family beta-lactamase induction signal transducer AmpG
MSQDALPETPAAAKPRRRTTMEVLRALRQPKVACMAALGFSSGLPFLLIGNTLGYWLREGGVALAAIGFLSWAGLAYSVKFIWGSVVDRAPPPLVGRLGRRRGWMIAIQIALMLGLFAMAATGPHGHAAADLRWLAIAAVFTGIMAASQDVVIDAWRIEIAADAAELGLLTSAYSLAFRIAIIVTDAGIIWAANMLGWDWSYAICGALVGVGMLGALFAREPERADQVMARRSTNLSVALKSLAVLAIGLVVLFAVHFVVEAGLRGSLGKNAGWVAWTIAVIAVAVAGYFATKLELGRTVLFDADNFVAAPFVSFFRSHSWIGLLMLAVITLYHLCDYLRGPIVNPYYVDLHIPKTEVAAIRATVGLISSFAGIAASALLSLRIGVWRTIMVGGVLQPVAVAGFALLTYVDHGPGLFSAVMGFDGFSMSFAGMALVSYMSTLTSLGYTATQYALLTSALAVTGKFLKGFSGQWVQGLITPTRDITHAYALFHLYAAATGIPALLLVFWLAWTQRSRQPGSASASTPVRTS